jgi:glycosyltransferase involved in cell wall biosynthesis
LARSSAPPEPRAVLYVTERADFFGGGQRSLRDLLAVLDRSRYRPIAVLPQDGPLAFALRADGVPTRFVPLPRLGPGSILAAPRALRDLVALARRKEAVLLHSDSPRGALYAGVAARLMRLPHVWHVRASRPSSETADRLLTSLARKVIAVSQAAARRSAALRRAAHVAVVPTGIDAAQLFDRESARTRLGLASRGTVLGVVGRLEADKGGEDALAAFARLHAADPGRVLVFVGAPGEDAGYALSLQHRTETLGLVDRVVFAGSRPDAAALLPAFDLLLHPSRHEALPRVLIEALLSGVPVVAAAAGGTCEVIEDGVGGMLVAPRDPEGLARAAERLLGDGPLRDACIAAGTERARTRFDLDAMARAIETIYEEILAPDVASTPVGAVS